MKLAFKLFLILLVSALWEEKSFSLTDYKIKQICKNERNSSICIKNMQQKRSNLQKGNYIEIPVIPYRGRK